MKISKEIKEKWKNKELIGEYTSFDNSVKNAENYIKRNNINSIETNKVNKSSTWDNILNKTNEILNSDMMKNTSKNVFRSSMASINPIQTIINTGTDLTKKVYNKMTTEEQRKQIKNNVKNKTIDILLPIADKINNTEIAIKNKFNEATEKNNDKKVNNVVTDVEGNKKRVSKLQEIEKEIEVARRELDNDKILTLKSEQSKLEKEILENTSEEDKTALQKITKKSEAFEDGYQFGDISKTAISTGLNIGSNIIGGISDVGQSVSQLGGYGYYYLLKSQGKDDIAKKWLEATQKAQEDYQNMKQGILDITQKDSILGDTGEQVASSVGQSLTFGSAGKIGGNLLTFASGASAQLDNSYKQEDVEDWQAILRGVAGGAISTFSENIFDNFGFGGTGLSDTIKSTITSKFESGISKALARTFVSGLGEASEEFMEAFGNWLTDIGVNCLTDAIGHGAKFDENSNWDGIGESLLVGFLSGGLGEITSTNSNVNAKTSEVVNQIQQDTNSKLNRNEIQKIKNEQLYNYETNLETENLIDREKFNKDKKENKRIQDTLKDKVSNEILSREETTKLIEDIKNGKYNIEQNDNIENKNILSSKQQDDQIDNNKQNLEEKLNKDKYKDNENANKFFKSAMENGIDIVNNRVEALFDLPNARGIEAKFDTEIFKDTEGNIKENVNAIYISDSEGKRSIIYNPKAQKETIIEKNAIHETFHDIAGTKESKEVIDFVYNKMKNDVDFQESYENLKEIYSKVKDKEGRILYNTESTEFEDMIKEEAVADYLGSNLGTQEYINELVNGKESRNIAQRIYDAIVRFLDKITGYKSEEAYLRGLKDKFEKAFNSEHTDLKENSRYSILTNSKNQKYVKADRQVINGNNPREWQKQTRNYINEKIRNGKNVNVITDSGDILTITRDTAGKAQFRNEILRADGTRSTLSNEELLTKLTAETHIDELAQISTKTNKLPVPDTKNHKFAKDGFDYRRAYFEDFDGQYYKITMSIGKNGNINTIYNIGRLDNLSKKNRSKFSVTAQRPLSQMTNKENLSSINSITKSKEDVNTTKYSIQENRNNTLNTLIQDNQDRMLSKEQQKYFKNSKVRDENGKLIKVYHTTTDRVPQFNEFNPIGTKGYRFGKQVVNYFTDSQEMSGSYANQSYKEANTQKITTDKEVREYLSNLDSKYFNFILKSYDDGSYRIEKNPNLSKDSFYSNLQEELNNLKLKDKETYTKLIDRALILNNPYDLFEGIKESKLDDFLYNFNNKYGEYTAGETARNILDYINNQYEDIKFENKDDLYRNLVQKMQQKFPRIAGTNNVQYQGYVNLQNPYIIDAEGRNWNSVKLKQNEKSLENLSKISSLQRKEISNLFQEEKVKSDDVNRKYTSSRQILEKLAEIDNSIYSWFDFLTFKENSDTERTEAFLDLIEDAKEMSRQEIFDHIYKQELTKDQKAIISGYGNNVIRDSSNIKTIKELYDSMDYYSKIENFKNNSLKENFKRKIKEVFSDKIPIDLNELYQLAERNFSNDVIDELYSQKQTTNDIVKDILTQNSKLMNDYLGESWYDYGYTPEQILKAGGYDGIIIKNTTDYGGTTSDYKKTANVYVTFGSNQFKADDNLNPTADKDIRYSQEEGNKWQEYLEKHKINKNGTRTTLGEIKLPNKKEIKLLQKKEQNTQENNKISLVTDTGNSVIDQKLSEYKDIDNDIQETIQGVNKQKKNIENKINNLMDTDISNYEKRISDIDKRINEIENTEFGSSTDWIELQDELEVIEYERDLLKQKEEELSENSDTLSKISLEKKQESRSEIKQKNKELFQTVLVNKHYVIDKIFKDTKNYTGTVLLDNFVGYQSYVNTTIDGDVKKGTGQTNLNNEVIGKSINEILEPICKRKQLVEFSDYVYNLANIERVQQDKKIYDKTALQSKATSEIYEKKYPYFKEIQKEVNNFFNNELQNTVDAGITTEDTAKYIKKMYPNFASVYRKATDLTNLYDSGRITATALKKAVGSNKQILPINTAMAEYALSMRRKIALNKVLVELNTSLYNNKESEQSVNTGFSINPENLLTGKDTVAGEETLQQLADGKYLATCYKDGKAIQFEIPENIYNLLNEEKSKNSIIEAINGVTKITNPLNDTFRTVVTTLNPAFTVRNAFKDFQSGVKNSKYGGIQYTKNYIRGVSDILTNTAIDIANIPAGIFGKTIPNVGYTKEYINSGLGSNSKYDKKTGIIDNKYNRKLPQKVFDFTVGKVLNVIEYVNAQIETAGRMSEFISALDSGKDIDTARYEASEVTLNFKRGGEGSKTLSRLGATFFNTKVLAVEKIVKNITGQNGWKGYANLIVHSALVPGGLALLNQIICKAVDDDKYEELPDYIKDGYYLIPKGEGEFFRIPKDTISTVIGSSTRRFLDMYEGNFDASEGDLAEWIKVITDSLGVGNPGQDNIFSPIGQALDNKSWYGGKIVSESQISLNPEAQYDYRTNEVSKWTAEQLAKLPKSVKETVKGIPGISETYDILSSPKKSDYVAQQYLGGIGKLVLPMATPYAEQNYIEKEMTTNSIFKSKYPGKVYDLFEEISKEYKTYGTNGAEYNFLFEATGTMSGYYKQIRELENDKSISDDEKIKQELEIRKELNSYAKKVLDDVNNKKTDGDTEQVGDNRYYKDSEGNTKKINEEKNAKLPTKTFADYYNKIQSATKKKKEETEKEKAQLNDKEKINILYNAKYAEEEKREIYINHINKDDEIYNVISKLEDGKTNIDEYLKYKLQDIESDEDTKSNIVGKKVQSGEGTSKYKTMEYINNSKMSYIEKLYIVETKYANVLDIEQRETLINVINEKITDENEVENIMKKFKDAEKHKDTGEWHWKK